MCSRWFFVALVLLIPAGCGSRDAAAPPPHTPVMAPPDSMPLDHLDGVADPGPSEPSPAPGDPAASEAPAQETLPQETPATPAQETPAAEMSGAEALAPGTERVVAEKGVGLKGRSLDEHEGMIVTPAKTYFTVRERVIFEITIPSNLNIFKATNGRLPRSHDEFMEQVIQANSVQLPELPPGQRYVYDPETGELMVERPQR